MECKVCGEQNPFKYCSEDCCEKRVKYLEDQLEKMAEGKRLAKMVAKNESEKRKDLEAQLAEAEVEIKEKLSDPNAVRAMILRGTIKLPCDYGNIAEREKMVQVLADTVLAYSGSCPHDREQPWEWKEGCDKACDNAENTPLRCWIQWAIEKAKEEV